MTEKRLAQQLHFLMEADKLKQVLRHTVLTDGSRRENDAEHSWHFALMAIILQEYADEPIDLNRVLQMAAIHDMVEIYAGDTFAYDVCANQTKAEREQAAAERLFSLLPPDQSAQYRALWAEYDQKQTPDARFSASIDRLQPLMHNYMTQGHTWKLGDVRARQAYARIELMRTTAPKLWALCDQILQDSIQKGYLKP